jgi:hypothetical protein
MYQGSAGRLSTRMGNARKSLVPVLATVAALLAVILAPAPTRAQTAVTPEVPLTVWNVPSASTLDGYGGWLATGNDPTAGSGQAAPFYDYFLEVSFAGSESFAQVALVVSGEEKFASLAVVNQEEGREHLVRLRFPWSASRYYFLYITRLAPGVWGGYVYDATAAAWSEIGLVVVPTRLGKLDQSSATGVGWVGPELDSCAAFPLADVYWVKPIGFVGQTPVGATPLQRVKLPGDCPATLDPGIPTPDFDHYQVGVQGTATAASATAGSASSRAEETRRYHE